MAKIYNDGRVFAYNAELGNLEIAWFDNAVPVNQREYMLRNHKIPIEAETNNWTRQQLIDFYLSTEVEDIADIPAWAEQEVEDTLLLHRVQLKIRSGT